MSFRNIEQYKRLFEQGVRVLDNCQYQKALDIFKEVVQLDDNNIDAHVNIVVCYMRMDRSREAIEYGRRLDAYFNAIDEAGRRFLNSEIYATYSSLGWCYFDLDQFENAVSAYTTALSAKERVEDFYMRGYSYYNLYRYDQAKADVYRALKIDPNHSYSLGLLKKIETRANR